jgi:hypothetical protein
MCCLTCTYYDPTEPAAHKIARESGQCESQCGKEWDWHTAFRYVQSHSRGEPLYGVCRFNPEGVKKPSWDICGQHRPVLDVNSNGWGIQEYKQQCGLMEWSRKQYLNIRDKVGRDARDYASREILRGENRDLRRQLAVARKRSASRLARLQKAAKVKPEKNESVVVVTPLRLVANGSEVQPHDREEAA